MLLGSREHARDLNGSGQTLNDSLSRDSNDYLIDIEEKRNRDCACLSRIEVQNLSIPCFMWLAVDHPSRRVFSGLVSAVQSQPGLRYD